MATIITRAGKGSPLTNTEVDDNFTNLNTDKAELSGATFTGNVGIGASTSSNFAVSDSGGAGLEVIPQTANDRTTLLSYDRNTSTYQTLDLDGLDIHFNISGTEKIRIDSSGNVLVGKTSAGFGTSGIELAPAGNINATRTSNESINLNRLSTDGAIAKFYKDGSPVGSIGTVSGDIRIGGSDNNHAGIRFAASTKSVIPVKNTDGDLSDNNTDLGASNSRFQDIYRSGSTYSTSDRNKKQDIRDLTDAEARVATVAKGSLKAFRYIDSVEAEGDEANIHFGIIAQDLKAAFEAEGLNANDYQVFKTTTYTDDHGVEQTTYSICYENLLAFIIAAI